MALMNKRYLVLLALVALMTGCVPLDSLNPLYADKDVVFDQSLLGLWVGPNNGEDGGLEFSPLDEDGAKGYVMTMFDKAKGSPDGDKLVFHAHLVNLGGRRFLDVVPEQWDPRSESYSLQIKSGQGGTSIEPRLLRLGSSSYLEFDEGPAGGKIQANLRRGHWIVKVSRIEKNLRLDWVDDDDFKRAVQAGTLHLPATLLGEGKNQDIVVTASTKELQKFVLEHADDQTFFSMKTDELQLKE